MTKLETLHGQIVKEQRRIEMLKNTKSNGDADWYDFVNEETKKAKIKILDENRVASWNNRYLVLKVLERDAGQKELEALAAYLQQP